MAVITSFERVEREVRSLQPTEVVCKYLTGEFDGKRVLQLDTYGSSAREIPGKLSQTLQLDDAGAKMLFKILKDEFGL